MSIESVYQSLLRRNPDQGAYGTYAGWSDEEIANSIYGSGEYADLQQQSQPQQQQQEQQQQNYQQQPSGLDDNAINQLYQQYLGRGADQGGLDNWRGQSYDQVIQGILGSGEYAQRSQQSSPSPQQAATPVQNGPQGGGGADANTVNQIYQQYLGRPADQQGLGTFTGMDTQSIINGILGSAEYAQKGQQSTSSTGSGADQSDAGKKIQDLADTVFNLYRTNQNYDKQLNELNSLYPTDPAAYFKARIGLSGKQMGWQLGQNTPQNIETYKKELESFLPGAKAAGVTDTQIQDLVNTNAQTQAKVNAERILSDAKGPNGWINQNIPGGSSTLLAAAAIAAPYLIPELAATFGTIGAGALTGAALGGANAAFTNQDVLAALLRGGVLGGAGAAASGLFTGVGSGAGSAVDPSLVASGGLNLGTNFTFPTYEDQLFTQFTNAFANPNELGPGTLTSQLNNGSYLPNSAAVQGGTTFQYNPATGQFDIPVEFPNFEININSNSMGTGTTGSGTSYSDGTTDYVPQPNGTYLAHNGTTGETSIVNALPANASPLNQAGPTYSELGYTPQAGPSNFELGYAPSSNTSPFSGFNPASSVSSILNALTSGTTANNKTGQYPGVNPTGPAGPGGPGGPGTGPGGNGTGTGTGTGTGPGGNGPGGPGTGPGVKFPIPKIPTVKLPTTPTTLKSPTFYQSAPGGLYKGNKKPFTFGKVEKIQNPFQNYDPFAALNVPQIPLTETPNLLAQALRQG
jgi:hypothetical protein